MFPGETPKKVLFVLSRVLGGKTYCNHLLAALDAMPEIAPEFVFFEEEDYARFANKVPWAFRRTGKFIASHILAWKLQMLPPKKWDALFVQSFELLPGCRSLLSRMPTILAHDSTQIQSYRLMLGQSPTLLDRLAYGVKCVMTTPFYAPTVASVNAFMPRTRWCAESLVRDYGVDRRKIVISPAGLDLSHWRSDPMREENPVPRILFVGNDFARKGGGFLLDLFTRRLSDFASLCIVSRDPALRGRRFPTGVEWIGDAAGRNPEKLIAAYRQSDLFVFPTLKEHMGMVLTEAAAMGLPIIARDVGGVSEIVRDGENGLLMPPNADEARWEAAIMRLLSDKPMRVRLGMGSRKLAERHFSVAVLRSRLAQALSLAAPSDFPKEYARNFHPAQSVAV